MGRSLLQEISYTLISMLKPEERSNYIFCTFENPTTSLDISIPTLVMTLHPAGLHFPSISVCTKRVPRDPRRAMLRMLGILPCAALILIGVRWDPNCISVFFPYGVMNTQPISNSRRLRFNKLKSSHRRPQPPSPLDCCSTTGATSKRSSGKTIIQSKFQSLMGRNPKPT